VLVYVVMDEMRTTGHAVPSPRDYGHCRWEGGCPRFAGRSGYCKTHTITMSRKKESDGVRSGSRLKLTVEDVAEAKKMWSAFKSLTDISRHFGVTSRTMKAYLTGERRPDSWDGYGR